MWLISSVALCRLAWDPNSNNCIAHSQPNSWQRELSLLKYCWHHSCYMKFDWHNHLWYDNLGVILCLGGQFSLWDNWEMNQNLLAGFWVFFILSLLIAQWMMGYWSNDVTVCQLVITTSFHSSLLSLITHHITIATPESTFNPTSI